MELCKECGAQYGHVKGWGCTKEIEENAYQRGYIQGQADLAEALKNIIEERRTRVTFEVPPSPEPP